MKNQQDKKPKTHIKVISFIAAIITGLLNEVTGLMPPSRRFSEEWFEVFIFMGIPVFFFTWIIVRIFDEQNSRTN